MVLLQIYDKTRKICWQSKTERTVATKSQPFPQRIYIIWVFYNIFSFFRSYVYIMRELCCRWKASEGGLDAVCTSKE